MIKEIKIENFKSIQSLNLELGRLNVFIGANGSGKSNILEGIVFGAAAIGGKLENLFLNARGVRTPDANLMQSVFDNKGKNIDLTFKDFNLEDINITAYFKDNKWNASPSIESSIFQKKQLIKDMWLEGDNTFHFANTVIKQGEKTPNDIRGKLREVFNFIGEQRINYLFETHLSDFMIFAPENTALRRFEEEGQIEPLNIDGKGLFKLLQKIIKTKPESFAKINEYLQLLDWFEGFEMPNDLMFTERRINIKDQFIDGVQFIDQRSANEGFLYLLFYLTLFISDDTPKFFAIDNIDNAMNPRLGRELIKTLAKLSKKEEHDKQVILTTHNPAILDGLNLNDDEQRLFVIHRNAHGHTKATRIFKTETPEGQRPLPLSEQFLRGYLGGLPDNF